MALLSAGNSSRRSEGNRTAARNQRRSRLCSVASPVRSEPFCASYAELIGDIPSLISKTTFVFILTKEGVSPFL